MQNEVTVCFAYAGELQQEGAQPLSEHTISLQQEQVSRCPL